MFIPNLLKNNSRSVTDNIRTVFNLKKLGKGWTSGLFYELFFILFYFLLFCAFFNEIFGGGLFMWFVVIGEHGPLLILHIGERESRAQVRVRETYGS